MSSLSPSCLPYRQASDCTYFRLPAHWITSWTVKASVTFWYTMLYGLKKHWLIVWEETLALQQAHCFRTGLWLRVCKTHANATWEATDPLEGNTAIKRSCPEKSRVFKQSIHISNTVCPKHTFVLANCAYAIKCLNLAQVKSQLEGIYLNDPSGGVQPPDSASGV